MKKGIILLAWFSFVAASNKPPLGYKRARYQAIQAKNKAEVNALLIAVRIAETQKQIRELERMCASFAFARKHKIKLVPLPLPFQPAARRPSESKDPKDFRLPKDFEADDDDIANAPYILRISENKAYSPHGKVEDAKKHTRPSLPPLPLRGCVYKPVPKKQY